MLATKKSEKTKAARTPVKRTASAGAKTKRRAATTARKSITFKLHAPDAQIVDIAGSFNNWTLKPMKRGKDGIWKTTFRPPPGIYEYKFLIDHRWMEDPSHQDKTSDGHGGSNSVCRVQ